MIERMDAGQYISVVEESRQESGDPLELSLRKALSLRSIYSEFCTPRFEPQERLESKEEEPSEAYPEAFEICNTVVLVNQAQLRAGLFDDNLEKNLNI